jgi:phosphoserine aminotransferase
MNKFYLTPGPSQLYHTVKDHISTAIKLRLPSWSHRGENFQQLYAQTRNSLFELLEVPEDWQVIFLGSATEIWERLIQNFVRENSFHIVTGAFSGRVCEFAESMGKKTQKLIIKEEEEFNPLNIPISIAPDLITLAGNETSTGYWIPPNLINSIRKKAPDAIIALDLVSALPFYEIPYEDIDCFYFSVQKGFGLPPGLGVWCYNKSLLEKLVGPTGIAPYRQFARMHEMAEKNQTLPTPNMLDIFLLGKVSEDMRARGLDMVRSETIYKFTLLDRLFQMDPRFEPFIKHSPFRSKTTLVAGHESSQEVLRKCEEKGMILGDGYGKYKGQHIRIANFPAHSKELFESLVDHLGESN